MQLSLENLKQEAKKAAADVVQLLKRAKTYRIVILIIGRPGSGKSTFASLLEDELNNMFRAGKCTYDFSSNLATLETGKRSLPLNDAHTRVLPIHMEELQKEIDEQIDKSDFEPITYVKPHNIDESVIIGRGMLSTAISTFAAPGNEENHTFAKRITMDGFHLPRSVLHKAKNSEFMVKRRGSEFTFDSGLVVRLVQKLVSTCERCNLTKEGVTLNSKNPLWVFKNPPLPELSIPDFDHEKKDPTPGGTIVNSDVRVVILEGLYLMYKGGLWKQIPNIVKENHDKVHVWKVKTNNPELVRERTAERHVKAGVCKTLEDGRARYDMNDNINGNLVDDESRDEFIEKVINN